MVSLRLPLLLRPGPLLDAPVTQWDSWITYIRGPPRTHSVSPTQSTGSFVPYDTRTYPLRTETSAGPPCLLSLLGSSRPVHPPTSLLRRDLPSPLLYQPGSHVRYLPRLFGRCHSGGTDPLPYLTPSLRPPALSNPFPPTSLETFLGFEVEEPHRRPGNLDSTTGRPDPVDPRPLLTPVPTSVTPHRTVGETTVRPQPKDVQGPDRGPLRSTLLRPGSCSTPIPDPFPGAPLPPPHLDSPKLGKGREDSVESDPVSGEVRVRSLCGRSQRDAPCTPVSK